MKYIENFNNPYVKLIIVCKVCNKEASKFQRNWKAHYLTHAGNEEKPHKCSICNHGFVMPGPLRKHLEKVHGIVDTANMESSLKKEDLVGIKMERYNF